MASYFCAIVDIVILFLLLHILFLLLFHLLLFQKSVDWIFRCFWSFAKDLAVFRGFSR